MKKSSHIFTWLPVFLPFLYANSMVQRKSSSPMGIFVTRWSEKVIDGHIYGRGGEEIVTCALKAFSDITGKETSIYQRGGGSDASDVVTSLGLPMPNFGPGDAYEESCSENESILLEEYFTFIKIYMRMVVKALG